MKELTNNLKKLAASLKNKKAREENNLFIVEGVPLCNELLGSDYRTEFVIVRSNPDDIIKQLADEFQKQNTEVYIARSRQFEQLATTDSPQGIIAVARIKEGSRPVNGNFIALDGISDPGNLGTIVRTADWFGFRTILVGGYSVDKYNPKVVRSTMGSIFRCEIIYCPCLRQYIKEYYEDYEIFGAALNAKVKMEECKPSGKFGIVLGNEAHGISPETMEILTVPYLITGRGKAESLNVAVAAGISMYHFSVYNMV